jgi:hypothetical protein
MRDVRCAVKDDGHVTVEEKVPLNLRVRRVEFAKVDRRPSRETVQLLGLVVSGVLLLAASRRRGRYVMPATAALVTGSLAALANYIICHRRRCADEARLDEQIEQSFPASDPAAP